MSELLTAAQMRAIERAAIESGEVTGLELMERAGKGVVEAIFEQWPELAVADGGAAPEPPGYLPTEEGRRAVVLCGPGNNGGDGFVVARLLKERGWEVAVFLYGRPERLPPDARANCARWCDIGSLGDRDDLEAFMEAWPPGRGALVVDAVFGTGLTRPIPPDLGRVFRAGLTREFGDRLVAVDVPSGLCADSGRILLGDARDAWDPAVTGWCAEPDLVVSFHRAKLGTLIGEGPGIIGRLVVKDIGLDGCEAAGRRVVRAAVAGDRVARKSFRRHKYAHGHALILAGGPGRGGAARLAARGALRIGAGLVTVGCPPEALAENAAQLSAVMLREVADAAGLEAVLEDGRINALCLGPGLGRGVQTRDLVGAALRAGRAVVLDADALTSFAGDPAGLFARLHDRAVLTPHGGEFARLFPDIAEQLKAPAGRGPAFSKVDATRAAAARAGCVVLFKGPDTVIADARGNCVVSAAVYERAAPWLATAGAGDVLAGFVAGLLARGFEPMQAAEAGAWLHVECARKFGPGLIAEDLPELLPAVFRGLAI